MAAGIWFVLLIFFIVVEASTVSVVSLWFAAGALAALVAALLHGGLWLQIGLFCVVSVGLLLALRPVVRKHFTPKLTRTNVDSVIGTEGFVTERRGRLLQRQLPAALRWPVHGPLRDVGLAGS